MDRAGGHGIHGPAAPRPHGQTEGDPDRSAPHRRSRAAEGERSQVGAPGARVHGGVPADDGDRQAPRSVVQGASYRQASRGLHPGARLSAQPIQEKGSKPARMSRARASRSSIPLFSNSWYRRIAESERPQRGQKEKWASTGVSHQAHAVTSRRVAFSSPASVRASTYPFP